MVYIGSKRRIANEILPIILKNRKPEQWYVEPFAGGMNLIDKVEGKRIANDYNHYLIELFKALAYYGWNPPEISKEMYKKIKDCKECYPSFLTGWAGFIYSFRGKFFGGFDGGYLSKSDNKMRFDSKTRAKNIIKQAESLKGVHFESQDYSKLMIPSNSIVYCDPPYKGTTGYRDAIDHDEYWDWVRDISRDNTVYCSEYDAPDDFKCIWQKSISSNLNSNSRTAVEKLFVYNPDT